MLYARSFYISKQDYGKIWIIIKQINSLKANKYIIEKTSRKYNIIVPVKKY